MAGKKKRQIHRLEDLVVEEVSIVDRPANQRPFLVVKNEDQQMADKGREIKTDENGNLVTDDKTVDNQPPAETLDIAKAFSETGEKLAKLETEEVAKRLSIPAPMRTELFRSVGEAMRRANTALTMVDMADTDMGEGGSTLIPVLAQEFGEVAKVFASAAKVLTGGVKKADKDPDKAVDEIEAKIESLTESINAELVAKRGMSKGRLSRFKEAIGVLNSILNELSGGGDGKADDKPKSAATDSDKRTDDKRGKTKKADGNDDNDDNDGEKFAEMQATIAELTKSVEGLTGVVAKQNKTIVALKKARPASNLIPVNGDNEKVTKSDDDTHWGLDLNDDKDRENVDKAISFHDT